MSTIIRMRRTLAAVFFIVSVVFVYRSFYGMRIGARVETPGAAGKAIL